jgi:hypothetical protein
MGNSVMSVANKSNLPFKYRVFYYHSSTRQQGHGSYTINTNVPYTNSNWEALQKYTDTNMVKKDKYGNQPESVITNLYLYPSESWKEKLQRIWIRLKLGIM